MTQTDVEKLLMPRYKVIADYPESIFKIGEILICIVDGEEGNQYTFGNSQYYENLSPEIYTCVFKKLDWWEEREISEMPEYVKWKPSIGLSYKINKVIEWRDTSNPECRIPNHRGAIKASFFLPATLSDYQAYIKNKK